MFNLKNIIIAILLAMVVYFSFTRSDSDVDPNKYIKIGGREYIELSNNVDTLYITTVSRDTVFVPKIKTVVKWKTQIVEIPQDVDTAKIIQNYYSKVVYHETYPIDSIGSFTVHDTLQFNRILSRTTSYDYRLPMISNTTTVKNKPINKFYIGGTLGFDANTFIHHGTFDLMMLSKKDRIYGIGIGASTYSDNGVSGIQPFIQGTILWRLKF